jgi:PIN domain nuclease of toxin-antitoxin system
LERSQGLKYLLDTHTWVWWNLNPKKLSKKALNTIKSGQYSELLLSVISLWEFSKLVEKGRLRISCDGLTWIDQALEIPQLRVVELNPEICWQSTRLPGEFHNDPADQIIVATARSMDATVISIDEQITDYMHVPTLW